MTKEQAQRAYRLAYVNALNLIYVVAKPKKREPYFETAQEKYGLTEEEAKEIWNAAADDMWRRYMCWRDCQIAKSEEFAEMYANIYVH